MAIVGGMSLIRRVLDEIRHFLFLLLFKPFCCIVPQNKKIFLKFKTQGGGRKRQGRRGPGRAHGDGLEAKTGKRDKCDGTPEIGSAKGGFTSALLFNHILIILVAL